MIHDYHQLIEKISKASGKEGEEINRLVEAKRAKLSGLISREGAAQIVASELGISFEKEKMKINEIMDGLKKVNIVGKILRLFPVRSYKKNEREGKVANFILADETGSVKTVLWDVNHISLVERGEVKEGDVVEITNAGIRNMELHLNGFSDVKKSSEIIENVKNYNQFSEKKISELRIGESVKTRAVIVQLFDPKLFEVCPECNGKIVKNSDGSSCEKHGKVNPLKRVLMSLIIDDGYGNIRAVAFQEQLEKIGITLEEVDLFAIKKEELLGKEAYFSGSIRQNKLFNNLEFFISGFEDIEIDKLIESLETVR